MSTTNVTAHSWFKSGTATTTETTAALAVWDANGSRPRKVEILNDGAVNLLYRIRIGGTQLTIKAGEGRTFETISDGLQVATGSGTCLFRAIAEG